MREFTVYNKIIEVSKYTNTISVKGNVRSDRLCFKINTRYEQPDLKLLRCIIKTIDANGKVDAIIPQIEIVDEYIYVILTITANTNLVIGNLQLQIQFHQALGTALQNATWQTNIATFVVSDTLDANEVFTQDPTVFQQWEARIDKTVIDLSENLDTTKTLLNDKINLHTGQITTANTNIANHIANTIPHVTQADKNMWNSGTNIANSAVTNNKVATYAIDNRTILDNTISDEKLELDYTPYSDFVRKIIRTPAVAKSQFTEYEPNKFKYSFPASVISKKDAMCVRLFLGADKVAVENGLLTIYKFGDFSEISAPGVTIVRAGFREHDDDTIRHVTQDEKNVWNSGANIAGGAITTEKLANSAVTTEKLANTAVTAAKLANGAVTVDKIASGSIIATKLSPDLSSTIDSKTTKATKQGMVTKQQHKTIFYEYWTQTQPDTYRCSCDIIGYNSNTVTAVQGSLAITRWEIATPSSIYIYATTALNVDVNITLEVMGDVSVDFPEHYNDTVTHVTQADKTKWNSGTNIADGAVTDIKLAASIQNKLSQIGSINTALTAILGV